MKKATKVAIAALILTFGGAVVLTMRGSGVPVEVPKYPHVPDAEFLSAVVPNPDSNGGKVSVCLEGNGVQLGTKTLDAEFNGAPVWAKQAAIAQAEKDILTEYNAAATGDGTASAAYVRFCYDCGGHPNCCYWTCHGVWQQGQPYLPPYCTDYSGGNCVKEKWICPPSDMSNCGFCDYVLPP